jgi:mRNA interferase MazF
MTPRYGHLYLADLNPRFGTEPGKVRPVVVVQTDALNRFHPSTIVCPLTTQTAGFDNPLRVALPKGMSGLSRASDVLVDQIKSIDNRRLRRQLGALPDPYLND